MKICVDFGATNIKSALIKDGRIIKTVKVVTDHSDGLEGLVRSLKSAVDALFCKGVRSVAFASAGNIDEKSCVCTYATGNLEGFTGFDFARFSLENYRLPCVALNDALAALIGEMVFGAGKMARDRKVAMLTLGSGVGGAYYADGAIRATLENDYARFGHVVLHEGGLACNCGRVGCIEQYLSGRALNRRAQEAGIRKEEVFPAFLAGDKNAAAVLEGYAKDLNLALKRINAVSPFDLCIIGGGVAEGMAGCFDFFQDRVDCTILPAKLKNTAGFMGAYVRSEGIL